MIADCSGNHPASIGERCGWVLLDRAHHQALDAPIPGNGGPAEQEGGKMLAMFGMPGQSLLQLEELTLAFVLSALVGLEREFRQKSAGLRTYTLVGVSAALFMLISKYGFMDVLAANRIVLDPSRVAAQIVSGIGFIGGGVIFMRRDVVRGLTTAASVWLTAALGMACGAGLPLLALATVVGHFVIMFIFPKLAVYIPRQRRTATRLRIAYTQRRGLLQAILVACTQLRFAIDQVEVEHAGSVGQENGEEAQDRADWEGNEEIQQSDDVAVLMVVVKGKRPIWVGRPIHTKTYAKEGS